MGATEEQMAWLDSLGVSHVSYILVIYSISFLLFLFVCMLLNLYANHAWPITPKNPIAMKRDDGANGRLGNGSTGSLNAQARDRDRRIKDAEEFELEGLMSEDEEEQTLTSLDSPVSVKERKEMLHV